MLHDADEPISPRVVQSREHDPSLDDGEESRDGARLPWRACRARCIFMPSDPPQEAMMAGTPDTVIDPVCGMYVDAERAAATRDLDGRSYCFCSQRCAQKFDADAPAYLAAARGEEWRTWPGDELI